MWSSDCLLCWKINSIKLVYQFKLKKMTKLFCFIFLFLFSTCLTQNYIHNCTELQNIPTNNPGEFILFSDINCTNFNFQPIGNLSSPFQGTLSNPIFFFYLTWFGKLIYITDGNSHSIINLNITSSLSQVAMFVFGQNANINNISMIVKIKKDFHFT